MSSSSSSTSSILSDPSLVHHLELLSPSRIQSEFEALQRDGLLSKESKLDLRIFGQAKDLSSYPAQKNRPKNVRMTKSYVKVVEEVLKAAKESFSRQFIKDDEKEKAKIVDEDILSPVAGNFKRSVTFHGLAPEFRSLYSMKSKVFDPVLQVIGPFLTTKPAVKHMGESLTIEDYDPRTDRVLLHNYSTKEHLVRSRTDLESDIFRINFKSEDREVRLNGDSILCAMKDRNVRKYEIVPGVQTDVYNSRHKLYRVSYEDVELGNFFEFSEDGAFMAAILSTSAFLVRRNGKIFKDDHAKEYQGWIGNIGQLIRVNRHLILLNPNDDQSLHAQLHFCDLRTGQLLQEPPKGTISFVAPDYRSDNSLYYWDNRQSRAFTFKISLENLKPGKFLNAELIPGTCCCFVRRRECWFVCDFLNDKILQEISAPKMTVMETASAFHKIFIIQNGAPGSFLAILLDYSGKLLFEIPITVFG